jgi:hypothetical protein
VGGLEESTCASDRVTPARVRQRADIAQGASFLLVIFIGTIFL